MLTIENIFKIIKSYQSENISSKIVIILSAIQNTTDLLYEFINNYTVNNLEKIKNNHNRLINQLNITNLDKIYKLNDLAAGDVMFSATGVTDGTMLRGININKNFATTHSIVMRSKTGTIREIDGKHNFDIKQLDY